MEKYAWVLWLAAPVVATVLVALCLVPAALLPRRKASGPVDNDRAATLTH